MSLEEIEVFKPLTSSAPPHSDTPLFSSPPNNDWRRSMSVLPLLQNREYYEAMIAALQPMP